MTEHPWWCLGIFYAGWIIGRIEEHARHLRIKADVEQELRRR